MPESPTAIGVSVGLAAGTINSLGTTELRSGGPATSSPSRRSGDRTEPDAGSMYSALRMTVKPDGDEFILNGQKTFITNGPYADTMVVYAKLDDGSGVDRRDQPVLPFVLRGMEGLTQGNPFHKMGNHSSPTGELFFENIRLGRDRLLAGKPGSDGRESAKANFVAERVGMATFSLGIIEECQRLSIDYAKTRMLYGKPIGELQLIQLKLLRWRLLGSTSKTWS
ncbi:MAG: acyl-CoA dehydrogenase [Nocardioidaceae bacterium]